MSDTKDDATFYFAEYNLIDKLPEDETHQPSTANSFRDALLEFVETDDAVRETEDGSWYFGDPKRYDDFLVGTFGMMYEDEPEVYNFEKGDFEKEDTPNYDSDVAHFILHLEKKLLIYNSKGRVRRSNFIQNFQKGFNRRFDLSIDISPLKNRTHVGDVINNYEVKEGEFTLWPSNPHSDPEWEELDTHIKDMKADKLEIDVESKEHEGLNFEDEALKSFFSMSTSEYGNYEIYYEDEKDQLRVITSDKEEPVKKKDDEPTEKGTMKAMADELIEYAESFR